MLITSRLHQMNQWFTGLDRLLTLLRVMSQSCVNLSRTIQNVSELTLNENKFSLLFSFLCLQFAFKDTILSNKQALVEK